MALTIGAGWNIGPGWSGSSYTFTAQFLAVAGGGGGGGGGSAPTGAVGGTGGTGGVASVTQTITAGVTYTIVVGSGNAGGPAQNFAGTPGGPTAINPGPGAVILCNGGGGGSPGSGVPSPGNPGTPGSAPVGGPGSPTPAGLVSSITGTTITYGNGSSYGAGGPGGGPSPTGGPGARGTPGIVIISIPTINFPGTATGATITTPPAAPGQTILTYTAPPTAPASYTYTS